MKTLKKRITSLLMIIVMISSLILPCVEAEAKTSVKLNKTNLTIYEGASSTLKVTGTTKTVKWATSKKVLLL